MIVQLGEGEAYDALHESLIMNQKEYMAILEEFMLEFPDLCPQEKSRGF